jgi:15-cis-phytoene desaturase
MDTGCLSSMNITGANQARAFVGQLPTKRCFSNGHHRSVVVKSLALRNKGKRLHCRPGALKVHLLFYCLII